MMRYEKDKIIPVKLKKESLKKRILNLSQLPLHLHQFLIIYNIFCYIAFYLDPTFLITAIFEGVALSKSNRRSVKRTLFFSILIIGIHVIRTIITFNFTHLVGPGDLVSFTPAFHLENYIWSVFTVIMEGFIIAITFYNLENSFSRSILHLILGQLLFLGILLGNMLVLLDAPFEKMPTIREFHIILTSLSIGGLFLLLPVQRWRKFRKIASILLSLFLIGCYIFYFVYDWEIIVEYHPYPYSPSLSGACSDCWYTVLFGIIFSLTNLVLIGASLFKNSAGKVREASTSLSNVRSED